MTAKELVLDQIFEQGIAINHLAVILGMKAQVLRSKLFSCDKTDLRMNDAAMILDKLGYRIAFIPKHQKPHRGEIEYGEGVKKHKVEDGEEFVSNNTLDAAMKYGGGNDNTAEH